MGDLPLHTDIEPKEFWSATMVERVWIFIQVAGKGWPQIVPFAGTTLRTTNSVTRIKGVSAGYCF